jgi:nicotinate (nicotinamide) nucleotide adenylyltransferase
MWMRASRLRSAAVPLLGGTAAAALYGLHSSTQACFVGSPASCEKDDGQLMGRSTERLIPAASRKRIAIYGGSFNPITNAHLNVAAEIMHSKLADEVWITPCGRRPDKPGLKTSMVHRLVMCHLAVDTTFGSRFGVKVCDEEADKPQAMPSIVLMRTLARKYPEADFMFACGADQIVKVKEWTAPGEPGFWDEVPDAGQEFFNETHFLLIERPGSELADSTLPPRCSLVSAALKARGSTMIETQLSSTEVRNRVRPPDDIVRHGLRKEVGFTPSKAWYDEAEGLVPPSVLGHIVRYGLYAREDDALPFGKQASN